jgi:hypothetical protein
VIESAATEEATWLRELDTGPGKPEGRAPGL